MAKKTSILEELRGRLLDLSLRNNLLNYHALAARSIEITDEHLGEVYSLLVLKEKGLKFYPNGVNTETPEEKNIWKYPIFSNNPKYTDLLLNTPYTEVELRKKLYTLQGKSKTVFEEQGYPILYLALGFVEWNDAAAKGLKAPLLMIPVNLNKQKIKENYTLTWSGEEPVVSPSLIAKLGESGIILPEFGHPETPEDIQIFFETVDSQLQTKEWKLLPNIVLDLFSFKKYVMYKDLDDASWGDGFTIEDSPLVKSIFSPVTPDTTPIPAYSLKSSDFTSIMDADSSQLAVIAEAKTGKNLVVEGPPGTGKSQTIANLIAEMLLAGKSVLFVSEKMAALQVVKRRLDSAGLSRFILELHSQNAKKSDFLRELESCLHHTETTSTAGMPHADTKARIQDLSTELSGYCAELRTPVGACGYTPYDLFGIREQYRYEFEDINNQTLPSIAVTNASSVTPDDFRTAITALTDIVSYIPTVLHEGENLTSHPWAMAKPGRILPGDRDEIHQLAQTFYDSIHTVNTTAEFIADTASLPFIPKNEDGLPVFFATCRHIGKDLPLTRETYNNPLWKNHAAVDSLVSGYRKIHTLRDTVNKTFTPDIAGKNVSQMYQTYLKYSMKSSFSRMFSSEYKNLKAEIRSCLCNPNATDTEILNGLNTIKTYSAERDIWQEKEHVCTDLFSPVWNGNETDPDLLESYTAWIRVLHEWEHDGRITPETIDGIISGHIHNTDQLIAKMESCYPAAQNAFRQLTERIGISETGIPKDFSEMEQTALSWVNNIDRLEPWSRFHSYIARAKKTVAANTADRILTGSLTPESIIPSFIIGYTDALLKETYNTRPLLAQFAQSPHEQKIETFRTLDRQIIRENANTIVTSLSRQIPVLFGGASRESEMGILSGEFNRKRGHMAIRTLLTKSGGLIQKIKPCFMMSPLSVAQYLDPRSVAFDIIIFDEASQVKPEDALGALMRGRQLVVMGDSRQLPPTSFFDSVSGNTEDGDGEESVAEITDMESLLHACKQVYTTRRLTWHYRSRHESLIAVSNAEFYDGSLFIFPSPKHDTADLGLSFVHTEGTVYERGKGGANRGEAKQVAAAVIDYYRKFPNKTLGVATFSVKQQESIRHEVDLLLREHPDIESLMHANNGEDFFVKNLETVQGDERDTILISIGYGYDEEHKLSRNFGPLNQAGGERRLNVLITRARERCVVYANFRGYDLSIGPDTPRGVAALARFLIYAETRNASAIGEIPESTGISDKFADTVSKMLENNGYSVYRNLGCAGFKIDIAVCHPEKSGIFIAGILCDGRNYWSAEDARDRDRLRLQVLEGLGWNLIRIWAPEWFCSPQECEKRLLKKLEDAKTEKPEPEPVNLPPENPEPEVQITEDNFEPVESVPDNPWDTPEPSPEPELLKAGFRDYIPATGGTLARFNEFASVNDTDLATAIMEITGTEGPLSENTLYARIKELGRVPRMTPAIKKRISEQVTGLESDRYIIRDEEGFISLPNCRLLPRIRGTKWDISDVSLSELLLTAEIILERQHATPKEELARITASLLGFKATANVRERSSKAIDMGIRYKLIREENGICEIV